MDSKKQSIDIFCKILFQNYILLSKIQYQFYYLDYIALAIQKKVGLKVVFLVN